MNRKLSPKKNKISVIVPVFNEIGIIKDFHSSLLSALNIEKQPYEIIYIDDDSNDGTREWLSRQVKKNSSGKNKKVKVFRKKGIKGKAFSLIQGFNQATGQVLAMIDSDLQYPPEEIISMTKLLDKTDIVVADRRYKNISFPRKFLSKTFRRLFGKSLFGLNCDIQSGLKVFKKEVLQSVNPAPNSPWTFDLEFLSRAKYAGFSIKNHLITFSERKAGQSKINVFASIFEIGINAIKLKFKPISPLIIAPESKAAMRGSGLRYKHKKYITHTTLSYRESALETFSQKQILIISALILSSVLALIFFPLFQARLIITVLSLLYFIDTVFNLYLNLSSLKKPVEVTFDYNQLSKLKENELPVYSILCPLYKEANVISQFLKAIARIDWPKNKLDVILLLEEDDKETISQAKSLSLPPYVRIIIVPDSQPKTKPKACNYGLSYARGEYLVIYDAEDMPDPLQLKKAYLGFRELPSNIRCLQAKLNYYNPNQNFLTRLFTAEYSLWFDLTLTGLQSLNTSIPLGGTSNHFSTQDLRELQGWDPFNVTEDADLGIRLFKKGYKTAIIDSTTLEEANSSFRNWFRQRSRWIKGYFQTYLVHTRDFKSFIKTNGLWHAFIFHLTVGGKLLFLILNPFMWVITAIYFAFYNHASAIIELIYYQPIAYLAVFSWVFGNFLFLYYYMVACGKRNQWDLVKYVYLVPIYWLMMSWAAGIAFYQLISRPHYWEKTIHGFHLDRNTNITAVSHGQKIPIFTPQPARPALSLSPGWLPFRSIIKSLSVALYYGIFLGADIYLINKIYPSEVYLPYTYLSIVGKSLFVAAHVISFSLLFMVKKFNHRLAEKREVSYLIFSTFLSSWIGVIIFSLQLYPILPDFMGLNINSVNYLMPSFTISMMCFAMANTLILYNIKKRVYAFLFSAYIVSALHLSVIFFSQAGLSRLMQLTLYLSGAEVLFMFILHLNKKYFRIIENNIHGVLGLMGKDNLNKSNNAKKPRILIFNWRDTKHLFSGAEEIYIHELSKRWVKQGSRVTLFCANDNNRPYNETVEGVEILRRGGAYTVYIFAIIYYLLKFKNNYDHIIDCHNGIPFFTPLYVRKPITLIIQHMRHDITREYLRFPLDKLASILESRLLPALYTNQKIVTVSNSTKEDISRLGFTKKDNIEIVHYGISLKNSGNVSKTSHPSFIYLGSLRKYKNIETALTAFSIILLKHKKAKLKIVGQGENHKKLIETSKALNISSHVEFLGKVSGTIKSKLLSESWAALQPSQIEGWGITVIEANSCGTPVIASDVNGLRDSVINGKTGLLVENKNAQSFAKAMEELIINKSLRKSMSREAFIWSKNFSWDKSSGIFYDLIDQKAPYQTYKTAPSYSEVRL
jgi:hypothetical protein